MSRWIQSLEPPYKLVERDKYVRPKEATHSIFGDLSSFVSPVDGSVITDRNQLREHNKRNNVVNSSEFSPEFYAEKAKERADFYQGKHSSGESLKRKQEIYENWIGAERNG